MYLWLWFGSSVVKHPLQKWKVPGSIPSPTITFSFEWWLSGTMYQGSISWLQIHLYYWKTLAFQPSRNSLPFNTTTPSNKFHSTYRDGPIHTDTDFCIWITYRYWYWFSQKYRLTYTDYYDHRSVTTTYSHNVHPIHWCTNLRIYCLT